MLGVARGSSCVEERSNDGKKSSFIHVEWNPHGKNAMMEREG
jgi:hypothetical protein